MNDHIPKNKKQCEITNIFLTLNDMLTIFINRVVKNLGFSYIKKKQKKNTAKGDLFKKYIGLMGRKGKCFGQNLFLEINNL